jgi:hypothetical protein
MPKGYELKFQWRLGYEGARRARKRKVDKIVIMFTMVWSSTGNL